MEQDKSQKSIWIKETRSIEKKENNTNAMTDDAFGPGYPYV